MLGKTDAEVVEFLLNLPSKFYVASGEVESFSQVGIEYYSNEHIVDEIRELLLGGAFVKFANARVAQDRINTDYDRVISIIKLTIPEQK